MSNKFAEISIMFKNMGFKSTHKGVKYLKELILFAISGREILPLVSNGYTYLSNKYGVSKENIEKNIQNSISYCWTYGNLPYLYSIFKETIDVSKGKPTTKQFLLTLIDIISY